MKIARALIGILLLVTVFTPFAIAELRSDEEFFGTTDHYTYTGSCDLSGFSCQNNGCEYTVDTMVICTWMPYSQCDYYDEVTSVGTGSCGWFIVCYCTH